MAKAWVNVQRPLLYALCFQPVGLMLSCLWLPERQALWWLLPLAHLAVSLCCLFVRGRWRLTAGITGSVLLASAGMALLPWHTQPRLIVLIALYVILTLSAMPMGARKDEEVTPWAVVAGAIAYLLGQFMSSHFDGRWDAMGTPVLVCFLAWMLLTMLMLNRIALEHASLGYGGLSQALKRYGRWLTLGLFLLAAMLACISLLSRALRAAYGALLSAVAWLTAALLALLTHDGPADGGGAGGGGEMMMLPPGDEPGWFAVMLEKVMAVIAFLIFAALVVVLLRKMWQLARKGLLRLMERLRAFAQAASADFVDEVEDTRSQEERSERVRLLRKRRRKPSLDGLEPRQRIRAFYAMQKARHPEWDAASTARETLAPEAACLYERARYSEHDIQMAEAERFERTVRNAPAQHQE